MKVRSYEPHDEQQWLRCRVLAFLDTAYYDNVLREKERYDSPAIELVAEEDGIIVGLLDIELEQEKGSICSKIGDQTYIPTGARMYYAGEVAVARNESRLYDLSYNLEDRVSVAKEGQLDEEQDGKYIEDRVNVPPFASDCFQNRIHDKPDANAGGDAVG